MSRIKAALLIAFFSASALSCAADSDDATEATSSQEAAVVPSSESPAAGLVIRTVFYSDASHSTVVGTCVFRTCIPKGRTCTGVQTEFFAEFETECN